MRGGMRDPQGDRPPATEASLAARLSPAAAWTAGPAAGPGSLPRWRLLGRASPLHSAQALPIPGWTG